jgi:protein AFG1
MAESVAEIQDSYRPNVSSYDAPGMAECSASPDTPMSLDTLSIFLGVFLHHIHSSLRLRKMKRC